MKNGCSWHTWQNCNIMQVKSTVAWLWRAIKVFRFSWNYEVSTIWQKLCWPVLKKLSFDIVKVLNNIVFKCFILKLLVFNRMCLFWSCWLKLTHCNHFFFLSKRLMLVVKMEAKAIDPTLWTFFLKNYDEVFNED